MNKVIAWIKKIHLRQILTVLVAGILLFSTQACAAKGVATQPPQPSVKPNAEVYVPKGDKVLNPNEGGMNNFSDVDPRAQGAASEAQAKAEFLKENAAQQQAQKQTSNPAEAIRRVASDTGALGSNIQEKAEDVTKKAQGTAEDFAKGTKRGLENIQDNTQDATKDLSKNVQRGAEEAKINAQRTAEDAKINVQRTAEDAANAVNRTLTNAD